ncbi:DUF86 domain-containing protein [Oceanobacillus sp. FSL K6-2867]|uniref:DUF86 domain-containing protein n=1 Tax=Oceanobacillus sp. FSL K6-2867 TaxID=2954748 RepID=UPI0030D8BCD0
MYFVDRSKIEKTLLYLDQILDELRNHQATSFSEKLSVERMVHVCIEAILDVGNMMIDGFIMRDPGSYDDIIDILIDEKVLPQDEEEAYKTLVSLRKMLVSEYTEVNHNKLLEAKHAYHVVWSKFSSRIRTYLNNELGVANAFSNE